MEEKQQLVLTMQTFHKSWTLWITFRLVYSLIFSGSNDRTFPLQRKRKSEQRYQGNDINTLIVYCWRHVIGCTLLADAISSRMRTAVSKRHLNSYIISRHLSPKKRIFSLGFFLHIFGSLDQLVRTSARGTCLIEYKVYQYNWYYKISI
jgi:hypothetical protein